MRQSSRSRSPRRNPGSELFLLAPDPQWYEGSSNSVAYFDRVKEFAQKTNGVTALDETCQSLRSILSKPCDDCVQCKEDPWHPCAKKLVAFIEACFDIVRASHKWTETERLIIVGDSTLRNLTAQDEATLRGACKCELVIEHQCGLQLQKVWSHPGWYLCPRAHNSCPLPQSQNRCRSAEGRQLRRECQTPWHSFAEWWPLALAGGVKPQSGICICLVGWNDAGSEAFNDEQWLATIAFLRGECVATTSGASKL